MNSCTAYSLSTYCDYYNHTYTLENEIMISSAADEVLQELITGIVHLDNDFIKGLYLTGSIALQDFHPDKSDIDFLLLCNKLPGRTLHLHLAEVHRQIERKFKKRKLNRTYLTPEALDIRHCTNAQTFSYHEGRLLASTFDMAPIALYELKTTAITLLGIPVQQLPVAVHINEVNRFLHENINSYWRTWLTKHAAAHKKKLLLALIPRLTEWVILGVARQLYTLRTGKIASKTTAGYYCLEQLPGKYHWIIQEAIKIRGDDSRHRLYLKTSYYVQPSMKRTVATLDCAYYIIELFNKEYNPATENSR